MGDTRLGTQANQGWP